MLSTTKKLSAALVLTLLVVVSPSADAFWAPNHRDLTKRVINDGQPFGFTRGGTEIRTLEQYVRAVYGLNGTGSKTTAGVVFDRKVLGVGGDSPADPPSGNLIPAQWMIEGAFWEDGFLDMNEAVKWGGYRAVNHFHNPIGPGDGGYQGLFAKSDWFSILDWSATVPVANLARKGISLIPWSQGQGGNQWGLPTAKGGLRDFLTGVKDLDRQKGLSNFLRTAGQLGHLVQDGAVPDHSRDLPHPGIGFEEFLKANPSYITELAESAWIMLPLNKLEDSGWKAFWDQELYGKTGTPTSVNDPLATPGLAEFSNANYLAFNSFSGFWFTTVPLEPDRPFIFTGPPTRELPWPKFHTPAGKSRPTYWDSLAPAKKVNFLAFGPQLGMSLDTTGSPSLYQQWKVDDACWGEYANPLLRMALGYAQSLLTLLMPPIRAEVVPDPSDPVTKVRLRVWNLSGQVDRVHDRLTWHLTKATLKGIMPKDPPPTPFFGTNSVEVDVKLTGTVDIAPGGSWESDAVALTVDQRQQLRYASHTGVALEVSVGTGQPIELEYGLVVPSAVVSIEQKDAVDLSPTGSYSPGRTETCSSEWSSGQNHQALEQRVTGTLRLYPAKVDVFGNEAQSDLLDVQRKTAQLAGVALVVADQTASSSMAWHYLGGKTKLELTGSNLKADSSGKPVWLRDFSASNPDAPDPETVDFQATLDFSKETQGATRFFADNTYLVAWTTSGSQWIQKLALWTPESTFSAGEVATQITVGGLASPLASTIDRSSGCTYSAVSTDPCKGTHHLERHGYIAATGSLYKPAITEPKESFFYSLFAHTIPVTLAGKSVPSQDGIVTPCPATLVKDGGGPCSIGFGIVLFEVSRSDGDGACPDANPPPGTPTKEATFKRVPKSEDWILATQLGYGEPLEQTTISLK